MQTAEERTDMAVGERIRRSKLPRVASSFSSRPPLDRRAASTATSETIGGGSPKFARASASSTSFATPEDLLSQLPPLVLHRASVWTPRRSHWSLPPATRS